MRQETPLRLAALAIVAAAVVLLAGKEGTRAQGDEGGRVFLPLALHGIGVDALPTAGLVTPVPTATDEPTSTPTIYVPATLTPEPSATATLELGATITGRLERDGEPLGEGLGDGIGPGLFLQHCPAEGDCAFVGRTAVDAEGRYTFRVGRPLAEGEAYQVVWWNASEQVQGFDLEGADLWLGRWFSPRIEAIEEGETREMATVDLGDIKLVSPTHGTGFQGFPIPFTWDRWPGSGGRYRWSLCNCCQTKGQRDRSFQQSVGTATEFELAGLPPGFRYDERYCWYIHVDMGEDGGFGESFAVRMMWFIRQDVAGLPISAAIDAPACP